MRNKGTPLPGSGPVFKNEVFIILNLLLKDHLFQFCPIFHFLLFPLGKELKCKANSRTAWLSGRRTHSGLAWFLRQAVALSHGHASQPHPRCRVEFLYILYLAQWGIVSIRESKDVCKKKKRKSDGNTEAVNISLIIMSSRAPLWYPAGAWPRWWCPIVCSLEPECGCLSPAACSLCLQEVLLLHFQKSQIIFVISKGAISIIAHRSYGSGMSPWISGTFYPVRVSTVHHLLTKHPMTGISCHSKRKTLIKKILGLAKWRVG